jgi:hypothetical protein
MRQFRLCLHLRFSLLNSSSEITYYVVFIGMDIELFNVSGLFLRGVGFEYRPIR